MAIFKTKALVLQIKPDKNSQALYTIFTRDYGKIIVRQRKNTKIKHIDTGYILKVSIYTSNDKKIPSLREIDIFVDPLYSELPYIDLEHYMQLLHLLYTYLPSNLREDEVFDIFEYYATNMHSLSLEKKRIIELKLYQILGLGKKTSDPKLNKIWNFIASNQLSGVLRLTGLSDEIYRKMISKDT